MSLHKIHEDPITPQTTKLKLPPISTPPIYLPHWQQSTKKEGDLVLSWRRRGLHARSGGELSGGVVGTAEVAGVAVEAGSATTVESVGGADVTGVRSG